MLWKTSRQLERLVNRSSTILRCSRNKAAYSGDGRTTVQVINQDYDNTLQINTYGTFGFRLNNGITVLGPMAIFPRTVLSWQVHKATDITTESLRLFTLLDPKLDLLIIGLETEDRRNYDSVFRTARATKLNIELLPVQHACSTYNFLNAEGRSVGAALIPPLQLSGVRDDDLVQTKAHYGKLDEFSDMQG